jgi:hypothetical protein
VRPQKPTPRVKWTTEHACSCILFEQASKNCPFPISRIFRDIVLASANQFAIRGNRKDCRGFLRGIGPRARAQLVKRNLRLLAFYQLITSNLEGQKSLAPVRTGKFVLSAGVGKEMADIALMVHWPIARIICKE